MRQLYPVLWLATLGLAAVAIMRPGPLGTLLAAAANWDNVPWSDTYTPSMPRTAVVPSEIRGPVGPGTSSRPAAWPGGGAGTPGETARTYLMADRQQYPETDRQQYPETDRQQYSEVDQGLVGPEPESGHPHQGGVQGPGQPPQEDVAPFDRRTAGPSNGPPAPAQRPITEPGIAGATDERATPQQPTRFVPDSPFGPPAAAGIPRAAPAVPCEGAEILARVGSEVILTKELSFGIADLRAKNPDAPPEALEAKIREILKQRLDQKIEEKLVVLHAKRTLPAENFPKVKDNVAREFENTQIPRLMKATGARSRQELEEILRAAGSSLDLQKQGFIDQILAHEWLKDQVKPDKEVSREERLAYYREHVAEFETPARARWEQLTVRTTRFASRDEAYAALAQMGDQVLGGAPFGEVAKAQSHGLTAQQGGRWDWTSQGSLTSELLDRVIFGDGVRPGLPVGALSPILEEPGALHIIRILQREAPVRKPFEEAQTEIKKKIMAQREVRAKHDYLVKLRRETPVWTAFDAAATAQRSPVDRYIQ